MSVANSYNHYINRLKSMRGQNRHYYTTAQDLSKLVKPYQHMLNKQAQAMTHQDAPLSARMEYNRQGAMDWNEFSYNTLNEARLNDIQRDEEFDLQIADLEFQRNEAVRQEKERKDAERNARKRGMWQALGQIGGTMLGAALGGPVGAMIGGGLGGAIGSVANGAYPQDWGAAAQGFSSAVVAGAGAIQSSVDKANYQGMVSNLMERYGTDPSQWTPEQYQAAQWELTQYQSGLSEWNNRYKWSWTKLKPVQHNIFQPAQ